MPLRYESVSLAAVASLACWQHVSDLIRTASRYRHDVISGDGSARFAVSAKRFAVSSIDSAHHSPLIQRYAGGIRARQQRPALVVIHAMLRLNFRAPKAVAHVIALALLKRGIRVSLSVVL